MIFHSLGIDSTASFTLCLKKQILQEVPIPRGQAWISDIWGSLVDSDELAALQPSNFWSKSIMAQLQLNLTGQRVLLVVNRDITETHALISLLTQEEITRKEVRRRAEQGIPFDSQKGKLHPSIARPGKQGKPYLLNLELEPMSLIDA